MRLPKLNIDISKVKRHLPAILTGVSIAGVTATAYTSYKAGSKKILWELKESVEPTDDKKELIPSTVAMFASAGVTIGAIIFNQRLNTKQKAELSASIACLTGVISSYQETIRERYSKEEAYVIDHTVIADNPDYVEAVESLKFTDYGSLATDSIDQAAGGDTLFYDSFSDRWFRSSMMAVTAAEYYLNRRYVMNGHAYLSDFYGFLGLAVDPRATELGWEIPSSLEDDDVLWLDFEHNRVTDRGDDETFYEIIFCREPQPVENYYVQ